MIRRFYDWFWPFIGVTLFAYIVKYSVNVWHFFTAHIWQLQQFDHSFMIKWVQLNSWCWRIVKFYILFIVIWYLWDWIRGYALLDFFSYQLRFFLLRNTARNTDQTFDKSGQKRANRSICSTKMRYSWLKPHNITISVRLSANQNTSKIVRERVIYGLGDDEITVISWLNRCKLWPLKGRHWELDQNSSRYIRIIGHKD